MAEKKDSAAGTAGLVAGGIGGTVLGALIATLLSQKPAEAATPEEKLNYLIECLTSLVQVLAEVAESNTAVAESNATLTAAIQQWLATQGVPPAEGIEVTVRTPWAAKAPEEIYRKEIRSAGTFYTDRMVNWTNGKRLLLRVNSSLNQAVQIQVVGNIGDVIAGGTDIGLAWDDWQPYVGAQITVATAPTAGVLTISAVIQE